MVLKAKNRRKELYAQSLQTKDYNLMCSTAVVAFPYTFLNVNYFLNAIIVVCTVAR